MSWEAPSIKDRPLVDRQNSDTTTCSDFSLDAYYEVPLDQIAIEDRPSALLSTSSDLELVGSGVDSGTHHVPLLRHRGYSSLTVAQVQELEKIAMPHGTTAWSRHSQLQSLYASLPKPETSNKTKPLQKRKYCTEKVQRPGPDDISFTQLKREGHNTIEKRYRAKLNEKISLLGQCVPSLMTVHSGEIDDIEDGTKAAPEKEKYSKGVTITRATEYITYLQYKNKEVSLQAVILNTRVEAFEKLAMSGSFGTNNASVTEARQTETLESISHGKCTN